jgi:hypothetical protein
MMIAQNPLLRATAIVTAFWYSVLLLVAAITGATHWTWLWWVPVQTLAISAIGLAFGFALTLFLTSSRRQSIGDHLRGGTALPRVKISLGTPPTLPVHPQVSSMDDMLAEQPWWPRIQAEAPQYASAIRAALRVMATVPRLPASPYPGGHAGRTLIVHSLAVATQIIATAKTWVYEGQKDKRGRVRVKLEGEAHRFTGKDIPMLVLTGLVHDIGKMRCYEPVAGQHSDSPKGPVLRVTEVRRNHDAEGAKLLRQIPEIMALPLAERTAIITAVGYYHHPFGLPNAGWLTDRIRSLTECLAAADIATGVAEGHALLDTDEQRAQAETYDDDDADEAATTNIAPGDVLAAMGGDEDLEHELEETGRMAAMLGMNLNVETRVEPAPATTAAPAKSDDTSPFELRIFMDAIRGKGAISGQIPNQRMAWRVGANVYVMEQVMRRLILNTYRGADGLAMAEAMNDADGNAAPFTRALLEQLAAQGALLQDFGGARYAPSRSIFKAAGPNGAKMPAVFVVPVTAIPGAQNAPEGKPITLTGPLWGAHQGKSSGAAPAPDAVQPPAAPAPAAPAEPAQAPSAPPADLDDFDIPFGMPAELPPIESGPACAAALLAAQDGTISMERIERDGVDYLLIPFDSPSGEIVRELCNAIVSEAGSRKVNPPLQITRAGGMFFALPVPVIEAD